MTDTNQQIKFWQSEFGEQYTQRNTFSPEELDKFYLDVWGISRTELNRQFLDDLNRDISILEVGCNVGQQLEHLLLMGFKNLHGIEIQQKAIQQAKILHPKIDIIAGSALNIPFKDDEFDLVFTSGVLIHIHPKHCVEAVKEIYRCAKSLIWGFEYFSPDLKEIPYREHTGVLWKRDFCKFFLETFPGLKIVKERKIKYVKDDNLDQMFLLRKS